MNDIKIHDSNNNNTIFNTKKWIEYTSGVKEMLENQLNDRWIPLAESYPEVGVPVLIQFSHGDIITGYYSNNEFLKKYHEWYDTNYDDKLNSENIVAWRQLPKPYKEEE